MFATHIPEPVRLTDGVDSVLVHVDTMRLSDADGWLRCNVDVESEPGGRHQLGFGFYRGGAVRAAATLNDSASACLADRWGAHLERVLDDALAVLDPHRPLKRLRFTWDDDGLRVVS